MRVVAQNLSPEVTLVEKVLVHISNLTALIMEPSSSYHHLKKILPFVFKRKMKHVKFHFSESNFEGRLFRGYIF